MHLITEVNTLGLIFLLRLLIVSADVPCAARSYGENKIVCVCNATYCDRIDSPAKLPVGKYVQYTSSQAGLRFEKTVGGFKKDNKGYFPIKWGEKGTAMEVNRLEKYQTMLGFGASVTDSGVINLLSLSQDTQRNLLRSYFSPQGLEYNIIRVPIAGTDFSTRPYTYDDYPGDITLSRFNLSIEDHIYKIPVIKRAIAMSKRPMKLKAAAWSAPPWMKTNNAINGFGFLKDEYYQVWADYHIKFLDAYKKEGLEFWTISTGNEPSNGWLLYSPVAINTMGWAPNKQFEWVRENLGPTLNSSQHNRTKIIALDDQRFELPWWLNSLKNDHVASSYIAGVGVHWYFDYIAPAVLLDRTHDNFPDKFLIQTEAATGLRPWEYLHERIPLGSWERGESYMQNIIENLSHWVTGWLDWNLALNRQGGPNWVENGAVDASIVVNDTNDEFYKQPMFYALGHFSKFVPEDSVRISITPQATGGLESIAFQTPDNATVIVLWNKSKSPVTLTLTDPSRGRINTEVTPLSFNTVVYW